MKKAVNIFGSISMFGFIVTVIVAGLTGNMQAFTAAFVMGAVAVFSMSYKLGSALYKAVAK